MSWSAAERFPCRFRKPRAEEIVLLRSFPALRGNPGESVQWKFNILYPTIHSLPALTVKKCPSDPYAADA